jgi:hypothetical protein
MEFTEIYYQTGKIIEQCNQIEEYLKAIIEAYISPGDDRQKFFRSRVLNNSVMSFGSKVKLVIAINRELKLVKLERESFHKIMQLRNAFAHTDIFGGIRMDSSRQNSDPDATTVGLESISGDGEIEYITREAAFQEFQDIYESVESTLKKMLDDLRA